MSWPVKDLHKAQGQLVMSEKLAALGGLVAGVAHEINTPVGVALSASSTMAEKNRIIKELFSQGEMKRSDLSEYLDSTRDGVEMSLLNLHRASDLIRSFKMVAADQVSEAKRSFKVRDYISEILLSLRPQLKKTSHRIEVECDENLVIESYPGAFSQILTNFIVNSLTHAFDEGQSGSIRIGITADSDSLLLRYSDDGRGIPPEAQAKIFEPFARASDSRTSEIEGTGLGMTIALNIARMMNGTIDVQSTLGKGSAFKATVYLRPHQQIRSRKASAPAAL